MKLFRYVMAAAMLLSCVCIKAQDRMVAILQHGDATQVFYNSNAFVNALAAAESGDVITLSQGAFVPATINKAVTIIGVGTDTPVTKFSNAVTINLEDGESGLHMEGVRMPSLTINGNIINDAMFKRCYCEGIWRINAQSDNCTILQCYIEGSYVDGIYYSLYPDKQSKKLAVRNSIIRNRIGSGNEIGADLIFENCSLFNIVNLKSAIVKNCVVGSNCSYSNNIIWYNTAYKSSNSSSYTPSSDAVKSNMYPLGDSTWATYFGSTSEYINLTDAGKEKLIGTDGTFIGAYGGTTPYTTLPAIPHVTSVTVPTESNGNGKLPVSVTVEVNN